MKKLLATIGVFLAVFALQPALSHAEEQYVHGTVVSVADNVLTVSVMDENNAEQSKAFQLQADTEVDGVESASALKAGDLVEVFYESAEGKDVVTFLSKVEADAGDESMADTSMMDSMNATVPEAAAPEAAMPEAAAPAAPAGETK